MTVPIDPRVLALASRVAGEHGAHTAILYGSHARGDATERSDVDLLLAREAGPAIRDARLVDGLYLDAFVYPETDLATASVDLLRLVGARVLRERDGWGTALLGRVQALFDRGPEPLAEDDRTMRRVWAQKTLGRIRDDLGPDGEYRRMHLLIQSLEDYFALRTLWFRGSKEAFAWLAAHDALMHTAFSNAMTRTATDEDITRLVRGVYR